MSRNSKHVSPAQRAHDADPHGRVAIATDEVRNVAEDLFVLFTATWSNVDMEMVRDAIGRAYTRLDAAQKTLAPAQLGDTEAQIADAAE